MATAPDPFGDDILAACEDAFAQPAVLIQGTARYEGVPVIFDRHASVLTPQEDGPPTSRRVPVAGLRLGTLPPGVMPEQDDRLEVSGGNWRITDVQPDGMGGCTLILSGRSRAESSAP